MTLTKVKPNPDSLKKTTILNTMNTKVLIEFLIFVKSVYAQDDRLNEYQTVFTSCLDYSLA